MIKIKMYPANEGDAFLLSFNDENFNILIDMGLEETYQQHIKPDLINLKSKGKKLDLLIITHIDNDHIKGAIPFFKENTKDRSIIEVEEVWYNSYRHLQFEKEKQKILPDQEKRTLINFKRQNTDNQKPDGVSDVGVEEGITLASLLLQDNYNWNSTFDNKAVCIENKKEILIGPLKFILLSPNQEKLARLAKVWLDKLNSLKYNFKISDDVIFDDAFELYMQNLVDDEPEISETSHSNSNIDLVSLAAKEQKEYAAANGSSIALIIEYDEKKLLFLSDAHENIIYKNLKILDETKYSLKFEAVKISHHGSNKNISNKLVQLIESKKFLISTDGNKNGHPNIEAISKIILNKQNGAKEILFNYSHEKLDKFNSFELTNKYNYKISNINEITIN